MTLIQSILLGIVQGLTEFIPVSSSAHLVIVPYLLKWQIPADEAFIFDVLVQVATLVAVFAYFWKDIAEIVRAVFSGLIQKKPFATPLARLGWLIVLGTIPAGVLGLGLKKLVVEAFGSPQITAIFLLVTAVMLFFAERIGKRSRDLEVLNWKDSLWIGFFQAVAIFPGISRSGASITGGMTRDLERPSAARFSFLLSIPIMLAAGLLSLFDLFKLPNWTSNLPIFIPGFLVAALVGYLAIRWLLKYLVNHPLYIFSIYCAAIGIFTLLVSIYRSISSG